MRRVLLLSALLLGLVSPAWADIQSGAKAYRSGDFATAIAEFRKLADQGVPIAQFALGQMYSEGVGVDQDFDQAVKWYRAAAESNLSQAQYNLGVAYYSGTGAPRDYLQAARWYEKAARQGDARSQNNLGYLYESGKGVKQDYAISVEWYRLAAEGGNMNAQVNIGNAYRVGRGVEKDHDVAIAWLRQAVDKWDTSDPLKLWIVESPNSIRPYSESVGAQRAIQIAQIAQDADLLEDRPDTRIVNAPVESAPVETVEETRGDSVVAAVETPQILDEQLVVEVAALPEAQTSSSKRYYDLVGYDVAKINVSNGFRVQLGAFSNPENADRGWRQLRDAHPDLLGAMEFDVSLQISKVDLGSDVGVVFRVQAGSFSEMNGARALCNKLMSRAVDCFPVAP